MRQGLLGQVAMYGAPPPVDTTKLPPLDTAKLVGWPFFEPLLTKEAFDTAMLRLEAHLREIEGKVDALAAKAKPKAQPDKVTVGWLVRDMDETSPAHNYMGFDPDMDGAWGSRSGVDVFVHKATAHATMRTWRRRLPGRWLKLVRITRRAK